MSDKNLYQRINAVMKEAGGYMKKDTTVGYGSSSYTAITHDNVTRKLQPLIVKHGLVLEPSMEETEYERYSVKTRKGDTVDRYEVKTKAIVKAVNIDNPNESLTISASAHAFDSQDKASGKAYSMAVKYCYLKLFMIASGDDEEARVEESRIIESEKEQLKEILTELLKDKGTYTTQAIVAMDKLGIEELKSAIDRNRGEKNA